MTTTLKAVSILIPLMTVIVGMVLLHTSNSKSAFPPIAVYMLWGFITISSTMLTIKIWDKMNSEEQIVYIACQVVLAIYIASLQAVNFYTNNRSAIAWETAKFLSAFIPLALIVGAVSTQELIFLFPFIVWFVLRVRN